MYKRVLVATGGSPWSYTAVTYAIALAAYTGAELRLLTVLTSAVTSYATPDVLSSSELVLDSLERQGQELLAQAAARAVDASVPQVPILKWGNVPETIIQTAKEESCDLIVLGARSVTGFKRLMVGSTSNAVATKAEQPVLIVKQSPATAPEEPFWRRVLVATGGSPWSDVAVEHALELSRQHHLGVDILHVDSTRPRQRDALHLATAEGKNILALAEAHAIAAGVTFQTRLAYGNVVETILDTARRQQSDLIILGSRGLTGWKRLMLGSISNAVAAKSSLPVLIVKRFLTE
jgi:nucleotide-binding universal stress UspA family protein